MGARFSLSCPKEFTVAPAGTACVLPCPEPKGYHLTANGAVLSCTYTADPTISVPLTSTPMYMTGGEPGAPQIPHGASYEDLPNKDIYQQEVDRFDAALVVADAKIDKELKITTAFKSLQDAENARGTPAGELAYETARIAYYTLTKGDSWINDEQARVAATEAQPVVDNMVAQYRDLNAKRTQQQSTIEVINGLKDKVLSVKDDLGFSVKTFQKQVDAIRNQINIDKKNQAEVLQATTSWVDVVLNWLIAIVTIICIVMLVRRFSRGKPPTLEEVETHARLMRAQAFLKNANVRAATNKSWL